MKCGPGSSGIGGRTISSWVTVEATKASQIGKHMMATPAIRPAWVNQVPMPRFSTMPLISSAPGVQ
jgi:hypothetical protein